MSIQELNAIVLRYDVMGLFSMGCPEDEYMPEVKRIHPKLSDFGSVEDLADHIHLVFSEMFEPLVMKRTTFDAMAEEIWGRLNE